MITAAVLYFLSALKSLRVMVEAHAQACAHCFCPMSFVVVTCVAQYVKSSHAAWTVVCHEPG